MYYFVEKKLTYKNTILILKQIQFAKVSIIMKSL